MRNATTWVVSVILIAGALSAVVSMATVQWLYPKRLADRAPAAVAAAAAAPAAPPAAQTDAKPDPKPAPTADPGPARADGPAETAALTLIRRAAAGDTAGAAMLATGLSAESLRDQVTRFGPVPQRVAVLPGPPGQTDVLVWVTYGRQGARSLYQATVADSGKVTALKGPMAPEAGYGPLPFQPLDEAIQPVDLSKYKGRGLVLVAPRVPEAGLAGYLVDLQTTYGPKGIDVILVTDIRSPDWVAAARAAGFTGPVWKVKSRLDDVPLVAKGTLLGAYGILVDRDGYAVASLAALDPIRYGLPDTAPAAIAPTILQAYGLLP